MAKKKELLSQWFSEYKVEKNLAQKKYAILALYDSSKYFVLGKWFNDLKSRKMEKNL